jgi:AmmeMemoRadiSam system protein B
VHAHAQQALRAGGRPDVVVVLGVCHAPSSRRFMLCPKDFATPLGTVAHDRSLAQALIDRLGEGITDEQLLHRTEHSVEFQALWLAQLWPDDPPAIVPILVGSFGDLAMDGRSPSTDPEVQAFTDALREAIAAETRRVVVVASVDLAHLGPRYGHANGLDERAEREMEAADRRVLEHVAAGNAEAFFEEVARDGNARNVCGLASIYVTLRLGAGRGELVRYGQGRIDPDSGSVVSFAAVAFAN